MENDTILNIVSQKIAPLNQALENIARKYQSILDGRLSDIILSPGKRIRSAILFIFAESLSEKLEVEFSQELHDKMIKLGLSLEIIHLASLIHDDVLDNANIRRNIATLNATFDNKAAILAGDLMVAEALQNIASTKDNRAVSIISEAAGHLAKGEILQMKNIGKLDIDLNIYLKVLEMKTGSLFSAALEFALLCCIQNEQKEVFLSDGTIINIENLLKLLETLGNSIGTAFQLIDDVLDYKGDEKTTAKPKFADLKEKKPTLPLLYLLQEVSEIESEKIISIFHSDHKSLENYDYIENLMNRYLIFQRVEQVARDFITRSIKPISEIGIINEEIEALLDYFLERLK